MQILTSSLPDFQERLRPLMQRSAFDPVIDQSVALMLQNIRERGDEAVCEYAAKFDHVTLTPQEFLVREEEFTAAFAETPSAVLDAIRAAHENIDAFSRQNLPQKWSFSPRPGVVLGEQYHPLDRVACYIPGGTAPLVSTVLHTVTLASVAGVKEICVITPARADGTVNPSVLCACSIAGATSVYRIGGVYGVAAMAYGTQTIPKVQKIVGPGNAYVTAAKRQFYGEVSLDLVAGPSEILILADETANPAFIAADLLSQAEHGSTREKAVLVATDDLLLTRVQQELFQQARKLTRSECIQKVIDNGIWLIGVKSVQEACDIANQFAPEHLEVQMENPHEVAEKLTAAGAIFLGPWTPEPVGDFVAGPSHVLPTGGAALRFSGLTVDMFFRRTSLVEYSQEALYKELPVIAQFAAQEGLDGHGASALCRKPTTNP